MKTAVATKLLSGILAVAMCATFGLADPVALSPDQARRVAWGALKRNQPQIAYQIAEALQDRAPDDFEAAFLRAQALAAMGRPEAARKGARAAWRLAEDPAHKFDAAHFRARTLYAQGAHLRAKYWLRRATQYAPTETARKLAVKDFRFIRNTAPLRTRISFGVFPTSNINNGSTSDTIVVNGLPFQVPVSGQPHSGTGFSLGIDSEWRKELSSRTLLRLGAAARGTSYRLSQEARALNSGRRGSDFATATLELHAGLSFAPRDPAGRIGRTDLDLTAGRNWYGGNPLANTLRLELAQAFRLSPRTRLRADLGVERQWRLDNSQASADVLSLGATLTRAFDETGTALAGISLRDTRSDSMIVDSDRIAARLGYFFAHGPWGIQPAVTLDLSQTDYSRFRLGGVDRTDRKATAALTIVVPKAGYMGFAPTATLAASRNKSTFDIYSTRDMRLSLGVRSTF